MEWFAEVNIDIRLAAIVIVFIFADVITGIAQAIAKGEFNSSAMRTGMWHKAGSIGLLFLAAGLTAACQISDVLPEEFAIVYVPTCLYIVAMEVSSILENILSLNPELDKFKLFQIFGKKEELSGGEEKDITSPEVEIVEYYTDGDDK